jgi:hypothetical protein
LLRGVLAARNVVLLKGRKCFALPGQGHDGRTRRRRNGAGTESQDSAAKNQAGNA